MKTTMSRQHCQRGEVLILEVHRRLQGAATTTIGMTPIQRNLITTSRSYSLEMRQVSFAISTCPTLMLTSQASPSGRPGANPNLFKPTPALPSEGRRVSFQDGPPEEIGTPDPTKRPTSTSNKSKWQPLAAADPTPVSDHDPFTVGDSDDEDSKKKETKPSDSDRLEKAMAEATGEDIGSDKKLEPQEKTGPAKTKDKIAEEKLTSGKK